MKLYCKKCKWKGEKEEAFKSQGKMERIGLEEVIKVFLLCPKCKEAGCKTLLGDPPPLNF